MVLLFSSILFTFIQKKKEITKNIVDRKHNAKEIWFCCFPIKIKWGIITLNLFNRKLQYNRILELIKGAFDGLVNLREHDDTMLMF